MVQVREVLGVLYSLNNTVPGTRSSHYLEPSSTRSVKRKQINDEHVYTIKCHSFSAMPTASETALTLKLNNYATCIFYGFWSLTVDNVTLKFMHPDSSTNNFH